MRTDTGLSLCILTYLNRPPRPPCNIAAKRSRFWTLSVATSVQIEAATVSSEVVVAVASVVIEARAVVTGAHRRMLTTPP